MVKKYVSDEAENEKHALQALFHVEVGSLSVNTIAPRERQHKRSIDAEVI